jgi:murein DD-endopeptidase MepM/ murein hydrolase activator NlpD
MAAGKVVLSQPMHYQGNFVIIDHGQKKYSYYMHLHKLLSEEGDMVKAGEQIGEVGSTGGSTAPHLHVSFLINNVHVDPLSLLSLPVRK